MILEATYRGHVIRVLGIGIGPFHWSYSIDDGECDLCEDAEINTEELALRDGHTAALKHLDRQYAPVQGTSTTGGQAAGA
jgi:hypothetical protein